MDEVFGRHSLHLVLTTDDGFLSAHECVACGVALDVRWHGMKLVVVLAGLRLVWSGRALEVVLGDAFTV